MNNTKNNTKPLLPRLKMRGLKAIKTAKGTVAWSGTLLLDGKPVIRVSNDGDGGCNLYHPASAAKGAFADMRELQKQLEAEVKKATGVDFEPLDALTACMENGETGTDAVPVVKQTYFGT